MDAKLVKNNTKVRTPNGLIGRIRATETALKSINAGELLVVDVRANNRALNLRIVADLIHIIRPTEEGYKEP